MADSEGIGLGADFAGAFAAVCSAIGGADAGVALSFGGFSFGGGGGGDGPMPADP